MANSGRRYPLDSTATAKDLTGAFKLPDDFLVGLSIVVPAGVVTDGPARWLVKSVASSSGGFLVTVGYQPPSGDALDVAVATVPRTGHTRFKAYVLAGLGDFADATGHVQVGRFDQIDNEPPGLWSFDLAGARLDPDCVRPVPRGVSALVLVNGGQDSAPLWGDVVLSAGAGCRLTADLSAGAGPTVRVDFLGTDAEPGPQEVCECTTDRNPIRLINGVGPDGDGNFYLAGSECLSFTASAGSLLAEDTCAEPCCGADELAPIVRDLELLLQRVADVERFAGELKTASDTFGLTVLGARLGDRACTTCDP